MLHEAVLDPFEQIAAAGLFVLVGQQAFINVAVNLNLIPTKGMTLPFISYGGSSMLAMGLTLGMALALTRRRPGAYAAQAKGLPRPSATRDAHPRVQDGRLSSAAGGQFGGHLFPAQALAEVLRVRGWRIVLATDERGALYADKFPAEHRIPLSAATFKRGDVLGAISAGVNIARGVMQARTAFKRLNPAIVVGFGGYPSLPSLIAALTTKRRTLIHEQNAVLGRVNRLLAPLARRTWSPAPSRPLEKATARVRARVQVVGNPVRPGDPRSRYERPL